MDEFAQFGGYELKKNNTLNQDDEFAKFGGYAINNQPKKQYTAGNRAASLAKSATAGVVGAIPDTAALAYNLPAMGVNAALRSGLPLWKASEPIGPNENATQLPLIPSATHAISEGIDNLTDGYTETPEDKKWLNQGVEFAAGVASGGGLAKVAQAAGKTGLAKTANFTGSTNPWHIGSAGIAGSVMSKSQERGDNTLETIGKGAATQTAINTLPSIAQAGGSIFAKGGLALAGLGKGKLNVDAAKAAKDLDINLPKAVISDSRTIAYADRFLGHAPVAGNIMQKRYAKIGEKALKELDNAYESVISSKELTGIENRISQMYKMAEETLPKEAQMTPNNTLKIISDIREKIKAPAYSGDFTKINSMLNKIESAFAPHGIKGIPTEVKSLVNQKENLNNAIYSDLKTTKGQYLLGELNNAIKEDIALYGKNNPEWYKYFTGADKLFSKKAQRKELEKLFSGKAESHTTGDLGFNGLSKILNTPDTKDKLKHLVKPEIFERLEKLGTVAQAMARKNKNIINPSGTAVAQTTINWMSGLVGLGGYTAGRLDPLTAGASLIGASGIAHLLTDKKTLDLAIKFAETGSEKAAINFNVRMKQITGYTPVTLAREAAKLEQEQQEKDGTGLKKKFNDHIESNKQKPKG